MCKCVGKSCKAEIQTDVTLFASVSRGEGGLPHLGKLVERTRVLCHTIHAPVRSICCAASAETSVKRSELNHRTVQSTVPACRLAAPAQLHKTSVTQATSIERE